MINTQEQENLQANVEELKQPEAFMQIRNKGDFEPLVDIPEPNLINLMKFGKIDERKRRQEQQSMQNREPALPLQPQKKALKINVDVPSVTMDTPIKRGKVGRKKRKTGGKRVWLIPLIISLLLLLLIAGLLLLRRYRQETPMNFQKRLSKYERSLVAAARETGVWPSVTAAQLYIEAGDGPNKLADSDNNGFGLKWHDNMARRHRNAAWPVTYETKEYIDGEYVTIDDLFGKFANFEIGIFEHDRIWWNGYHEEAREVLMNLADGTREQFIAAILHYATDPSYRAAITKVIKEQKLDYLDKLAFPDGKRLRAGFPDLQRREEQEALEDFVKRRDEKAAAEAAEKAGKKSRSQQTDKNQGQNTSKPAATISRKKLKEEVKALPDEQKTEILQTVKEKMFRQIGQYPDDGYNVKNLVSKNLQQALTR